MYFLLGIESWRLYSRARHCLQKWHPKGAAMSICLCKLSGWMSTCSMVEPIYSLANFTFFTLIQSTVLTIAIITNGTNDGSLCVRGADEEHLIGRSAMASFI